jgi:hypothetical protein
MQIDAFSWELNNIINSHQLSPLAYYEIHWTDGEGNVLEVRELRSAYRRSKKV